MSGLGRTRDEQEESEEEKKGVYLGRRQQYGV